jgi:hypothetical protein
MYFQAIKFKTFNMVKNRNLKSMKNIQNGKKLCVCCRLGLIGHLKFGYLVN